MGKKITSILANHDLDTSNLENLANEIANRLGATVLFGYKDIFDYQKLQIKRNPSHNFVKLGTVEFQNSTKEYYLTDAYYQYKSFIEKNGLQVLEEPFFLKKCYLKHKIIND